MRLGINTFLFACPFRDRDCRHFPKFRKWGFDSVEIAVAAPDDMNWRLVRERLDAADLVAGSVAAALGPGRDLRGASKAQGTALKYLKSLMDRMPVIGSRTLIGPFYSEVGRANGETAAAKKSQRRIVVRHLKELAHYAADRGITLCVEPLNRFETDFLNTADQAINLAADVDHAAFKIMLDTFHMNIEEKDLPAAIRRCGALLGHLHASGSDRGTPGSDHTDWGGIVLALKQIGYDGDIVIESFSPEVEIIAKAASIWRSIEPEPHLIAAEGAQFLRDIFRFQPTQLPSIRPKSYRKLPTR